MNMYCGTAQYVVQFDLKNQKKLKNLFVLIRPWGVEQDSFNQKDLCPSCCPLWKTEQYLGKRKNTFKT